MLALGDPLGRKDLDEILARTRTLRLIDRRRKPQAERL